MLTISKPLSASQAQTYHQKEFTAKEQNYWSQRGVIAGEWQGRLAGQFGLAGAVSAEDLACSLSENSWRRARRRSDSLKACWGIRDLCRCSEVNSEGANGLIPSRRPSLSRRLRE